MDALLNVALNAVWQTISEPHEYSTPDDLARRTFSVVSSDGNSISITTAGGSALKIQRESFLAAIRYLAVHQHNQNNPCEIRSNQIFENAGPLCQATRIPNSGTRVINYIAPILERTGLVALEGSRPNTIWLA